MCTTSRPTGRAPSWSSLGYLSLDRENVGCLTEALHYLPNFLLFCLGLAYCLLAVKRFLSSLDHAGAQIWQAILNLKSRKVGTARCTREATGPQWCHGHMGEACEPYVAEAMVLVTMYVGETLVARVEDLHSVPA